MSLPYPPPLCFWKQAEFPLAEIIRYINNIDYLSVCYYFSSAKFLLEVVWLKTHKSKEISKWLDPKPVFYLELLHCLNLRRLISCLWPIGKIQDTQKGFESWVWVYRNILLPRKWTKRGNLKRLFSYHFWFGFDM